jgi:hypothetical protein
MFSRECIDYQLIYCVIIQVRKSIHIQLVFGSRYQIIKESRQQASLVELLNPLHDFVTQM